MFKVTKEKRFWHEVKVSVPVDGGHDSQTFKVQFEVVPVDELAEDLTLDQSENQARTLRRVVRDMADMEGEDGAPVPYSDELRDKLIAIPYVRIAMMQTYVRAVTKAPAGN